MPWPKGRPSHMKGKQLSKEHVENLKKACAGGTWARLSVESKERHREARRAEMHKRYASGWQPTCGRCKKLDYDSLVAGKVKVDGTWELKVAKFLDKIGSNWIRNTKRFKYVNLKGKISTYCPDFYLIDLDTYIEVKGYETDLDRCKWSQFKEKLVVLKKKEINNLTGELIESGKISAC